MFPSPLHFECITVDGSDLENAQTDTIKQIKSKTVDATIAHTKLFEDEEALVLACVNTRVEGALESVADQRLDASCVGETLVHG